MSDDTPGTGWWVALAVIALSSGAWARYMHVMLEEIKVKQAEEQQRNAACTEFVRSVGKCALVQASNGVRYEVCVHGAGNFSVKLANW